MKTILTLASALLVSASLPALAADGWMTDLEQAFEKAKKENKPVLVEFTGSDWCPPCQMMHKNVFSKKAFLKKASEDFILIKLDFPQGDKKLAEKNQPYAKKYKIEGFPTVVLFDSKAKEFDRFVASAYPSVEKFLEKLRSSLARKDLE